MPGRESETRRPVYLRARKCWSNMIVFKKNETNETTEKKLLRDANDEANKKKRTVEKRKKPKFSFTLSYLVCILYLIIKKISCLKRAKNLIKYEINLPHQPRRRQQRQSSARKVWKIQVAVRWLRYNARSSCSRVFKRFYLSRKMRFSWCDP